MTKKINIKAWIRLLRPKQWIKNAFVFAALIFSGNFFNVPLLTTTILVFILFSLSSSCVYILNDYVDIEKDRCHPEKKSRPLASGAISKVEAFLLEVFLSTTTIYCAYLISTKLMGILLFYILINIIYSLRLKNIVIMDVMTITLGFVLRVESGSMSTGILLSPWLILCTILLSLFLALNKRKSELITLKSGSGSHRKILEEYSVDLLDKMLTIVTPSILMAYCLYTFSSVQSRTMMLTIPFVLYGIFRYQYLMEKKNIGGKPEDVFAKDKPFLVNIILWVVSVLVIIYFKL